MKNVIFILTISAMSLFGCGDDTFNAPNQDIEGSDVAIEADTDTDTDTDTGAEPDVESDTDLPSDDVEEDTDDSDVDPILSLCDPNPCNSNEKCLVDGENFECVGCVSDGDCPSGVCDGNACVECVDDSSCGGCKTCSNNECVDTDSECGGCESCNDGVCGDDCYGSVCDSDTNLCVECVMDSHCGEGFFCSDTSQCIECNTNSQCGSDEICDTTFRCVPDNECTEPSDCDAGTQTCSNNSCVCYDDRDDNQVCSDLAAQCGSVTDGCGVVRECGGCGQDTCEDNQCVCVPTTCDIEGISCGAIDDGCGEILECGSCGANEACDGWQCICEDARTDSDICSDAGSQCGSVMDVCGNTVDCGSCPDGNCTGDNICQTTCGNGEVSDGSGGCCPEYVGDVVVGSLDNNTRAAYYLDKVAFESGMTVGQSQIDDIESYCVLSGNVSVGEDISTPDAVAVDLRPTNYDNSTSNPVLHLREITGNVVVRGRHLESFYGWDNLETVGGDFEILGSSELQYTPVGLPSLVEIGGLFRVKSFDGVEGLTLLESFSALISVGDILLVEGMLGISSLSDIFPSLVAVIGDGAVFQNNCDLGEVEVVNFCSSIGISNCTYNTCQ